MIEDDNDEILRQEAQEAAAFWGIAAPPGASYRHLCELLHAVATKKFEPLKTDTEMKGRA